MDLIFIVVMWSLKLQLHTSNADIRVCIPEINRHAHVYISDMSKVYTILSNSKMGG